VHRRWKEGENCISDIFVWYNQLLLWLVVLDNFFLFVKSLIKSIAAQDALKPSVWEILILFSYQVSVMQGFCEVWVKYMISFPSKCAWWVHKLSKYENLPASFFFQAAVSIFIIIWLTEIIIFFFQKKAGI